MEPFLSRKFIITILVLITATALTALSLLPADQWTTLVEVIMGIYVTGNVVGGAIDK